MLGPEKKLIKQINAKEHPMPMALVQNSGYTSMGDAILYTEGFIKGSIGNVKIEALNIDFESNKYFEQRKNSSLPAWKDIPVLHISGNKDVRVDPENSKDNFKADTGTTKKFISVEGGTHNDVLRWLVLAGQAEKIFDLEPKKREDYETDDEALKIRKRGDYEENIEALRQFLNFFDEHVIKKFEAGEKEL